VLTLRRRGEEQECRVFHVRGKIIEASGSSKQVAAIMTSPRKFSEKIALHNAKQAEETAAFEQVMRDVSTVKVSNCFTLCLVSRCPNCCRKPVLGLLTTNCASKHFSPFYRYFNQRSGNFGLSVYNITRCRLSVTYFTEVLPRNVLYWWLFSLRIGFVLIRQFRNKRVCDPNRLQILA